MKANLWAGTATWTDFDGDSEESVATSSLGHRVIAKLPEDIGAAEFLCGRLAAQMSFCILQMQNFSLIKSDQSRAIRKRLVEAWSLEKPDNIELELLAKVAA